MSASGYRALGFVVWHGGRWYVRRRVPRPRRLAARGLLAGAAVVAGVLLLRRLCALSRGAAGAGERSPARTPGSPPPAPYAVRGTA